MNEYLIALFEQQWKDDPKSRVFLRLAEEYRKGGVYEKAIEVCLKGVEIHPAYIPALVCLGRCHLELGQLEESEQAFQKVLTFTPDNPHALRAMGKIHFKAGRLDQARSFLEMSLLQEPDDEEVRALLAEIEIMVAEGETQPHPMDTEPMAAMPQEVEEIEELDDGNLDDTEDLGPQDAEEMDVTDSFEAVEIPEEALVIPPADSVEFETGPLEPLEDDSAPILSFDGEGDREPNVVEALDTEPVESPFEAAVPIEPIQQSLEASGEGDTTAEIEFEDEEPAPKSSLDDIDLQFELAMKDEDKDISIFPEEPEKENEADGPVEFPEDSGSPQELDADDEAMMTLSLKHERMMHFEESVRILNGLLKRYPRDPSVRQHLERVKQLMVAESHRDKKMRLLSNWLDKIKGVYYVS